MMIGNYGKPGAARPSSPGEGDMEVKDSTDELERRYRVPVDQAEDLIVKLGVDVSRAPKFDKGSVAFREAAGAYERLVCAQKQARRVPWERTAVNGRSGDYLMQCLWDLRQEFRRRDQQTPALRS
jgi:hypothetical protein